jgi:hypothetical protein
MQKMCSPHAIGSATRFGTPHLPYNGPFDSVMIKITYCPVKKQPWYQPETKKRSSKWQQGRNKTIFSKLPEQERQDPNSFKD